MSISAKLNDHRSVEVYKDAKKTTLKIDGKNKKQNEVAKILPVRRLHAKSDQSFFLGGSRNQQQYVDWGLFHVKPDQYRSWCAYLRVVHQRNMLLRTGGSEKEYSAWDCELWEKGEEITSARNEYVARIQEEVDELLKQSQQPEKISIEYMRGWPAGQSLEESLKQTRKHDLRRGFTHVGPHRAKLDIFWDKDPIRSYLSRGQQKRLMAILMFAQARLYEKQTGKKTILLIDDLSAEFDKKNICWFISMVDILQHQALITWVDIPPIQGLFSKKMFHVKQGTIKD